MRLAIVGSRGITDYVWLDWWMCQALKLVGVKLEWITEIVSGGAPGVDRLAEKFAEEYSIIPSIYRADWETHGQQAGLLRNETIVENCDAAIAIWDGHSAGTMDTKSRLWETRTPHITIIPDGVNHATIDVHFLNEWGKLYEYYNLRAEEAPFYRRRNGDKHPRVVRRGIIAVAFEGESRPQIRPEPSRRNASRDDGKRPSQRGKKSGSKARLPGKQNR